MLLMIRNIRICGKSRPREAGASPNHILRILNLVVYELYHFAYTYFAHTPQLHFSQSLAVAAVQHEFVTCSFFCCVFLFVVSVSLRAYALCIPDVCLI